MSFFSLVGKVILRTRIFVPGYGDWNLEKVIFKDVIIYRKGEKNINLKSSMGIFVSVSSYSKSIYLKKMIYVTEL